MSEADAVRRTEVPLTKSTLCEQLESIGLTSGQLVVIHSSLSQLGWVVGGAVTVIDALLALLGTSGTLVMPSHTPENTDPREWQNPPVPKAWWPLIRDHMPPYDPQKTPTRGMGVIADTFRRYPGVLRSAHPVTSFAALGREAALVTSEHPLEDEFGDNSPLGKVYRLDGHVLLLGVNHQNNTSLHVAECRAAIPKTYLQEGSAVLVTGERRWLGYQRLDVDDEGFAELGKAYEQAMSIEVGRVGLGEAHFMRQKPLVDWAVGWLEQHRNKQENL